VDASVAFIIIARIWYVPGVMILSPQISMLFWVLLGIGGSVLTGFHVFRPLVYVLH